jgi:hypothetical protein
MGWITTRYQSKCFRCNREMPVGTRAFWSPYARGRVLCERCFNTKPWRERKREIWDFFFKRGPYRPGPWITGFGFLVEILIGLGLIFWGVRSLLGWVFGNYFANTVTVVLIIAYLCRCAVLILRPASRSR